MSERRRDQIALLLALAVILGLAFWVFKPFLLDVAVAACAALLLAPVQTRLTRAFGNRPGVAAALLVLTTGLLILLPVLSSLLILVQQTAVFLDWLRTLSLSTPDAVQRLWQELPQRFPGMKPWLLWVQGQVTPAVEDWFAQLVTGVSGILQEVLGRVTHAVLDLGLFLLLLFFLLRDRTRLRGELRPVSPFSEEQERQIFEHLERTVKGALQALIVVPVVQGILAGIGFMIFGIPSPFVWGTGVILAATVPILGAPLGWIPACLYLFATGSTGAAIGLFFFCLVLVSGSDNVVKPLLLQGTARIHPLLGFLSILGGLIAFGVFGFLIGPVVLSLVISAIRIYKLDVLRHGAPAERPAGTEPAV